MRRQSWINCIFTAALILVLSGNALPRLVSGAAPDAGSTAPSLWVTPLVLDFGRVGVGETSSTLTVTITNNGNATLANFAGGGVNSPFGASQNCAAGVLPGASCQYFFDFSPTATGAFTTTSSSSTNAGPFSIELRGVGVGAGLHVNPLALDFGKVRIGNTGDTQVVTIHNTGLSTLANFAGGGVDQPFGASQNCAGGVPPGQSCQYFFDFLPIAAGTFTTTSNSSTNAGLFTIGLMGQGWENFSFSIQRVTPRSLDFGPVGVGFSAPTQVVTITNQGNSDIIGWVGGGVYEPFNATQNCAGGLSPGESCQFYYKFNPTQTGVFTTTSSVSNSRGSFTIELRGEGAGAGLSASPLVLDFGSVPPGGSGTVQVVTIKNTGLATLTNFAGGGVNPPFSASQNCAAGVPPGGECQFNYNFNPTEWGRFSTISSVSTNAGSFSILLTGGAEPPSIALSFLPDQIAPGETAAIQYTLHNPNTNVSLFDVEFNNTLPAGMSIASPLLYSISPECGTPTFAPVVGATEVVFASATLLGGDDCVVNLNVTAANIGVYHNTTGQVNSASGSGNTASATLTVGSFVYLPLTIR